MLTRYRKSIAALVGAIATWGIAASADQGIDAPEWWGLLGVVGTVVTVWGVANDTPAGEPADPTQSERG